MPCDGLKKKTRATFFILSEVKPKSITTRFLAHVSCASFQLHVFASSFDWFTELYVPFVIGRFGLTTLN